MKRTRLYLSTLLLLSGLLLITSQVSAQGKFQPGDLVEANWIGVWVPGKIDKCINENTCMVFFYKVDTGKYEIQSNAIMSEDIRGATSKLPMRPAPVPRTLPTTPQPLPAATADLKYTVGQRVEYIDNGKWYRAVIIEMRDDSKEHLDGKIYAPYRVHPLGYTQNEDAWVCCLNGDDHRTQLRPAGSGPTEPVPGGEANDETLKAMRHETAATPTRPPSKVYQCVYFVNDQLINTAPFSLTGGSTYRDSEGKSGTYTFDSGTLTFHGGNYDGQKAEYDTKGGRPTLHILGRSGRRVIDCD